MTNVIRGPSLAKREDFFDDAIATAKVSFLVGGALGLQKAYMAHKQTAVLLDIVAYPGVPATVFKSAVYFYLF